MRYCEYCRAEIKNDAAKFCHKCSAQLQPIEEQKKIENDDKHVQLQKPNVKEVEIEIVPQNANLCKSDANKKGYMFETTICEILQATGWSTQQRKSIDGPKVPWQVDILATRQLSTGRQEKLIVECKNYESSVSKEIVALFQKKLEEVQIKNGLIAVYKDFSNDAYKEAEGYPNIQLWNGEQIYRKWYESKTCRLEVGEKVKLEYCLPINIDFDEVVKINFENKNNVEIVTARLIWRPFYVVSYKLKALKADPSKQMHSVEDSGNMIIDALRMLPKDAKGSMTGIMGALGLIESNAEEKRKDKEDEIFLRLLNQEPVKALTLNQNKSYQTIKVDPKITENDAKTKVINRVIINNSRNVEYWGKNQTFLDAKDFEIKPKPGEINIISMKLVFVPKWEIEYSSKDYSYFKLISASDGSVIFDNVTYCPAHLSIGFLKKKSIAVCDVCGRALCQEHVTKCPACGSWRCATHSIQCIECRKRYCHEHISTTCDECKSPVCSTCGIKCPICGQTHCSSHSIKCSKCSRVVCISCTRKEGGLLTKKVICKECK